MPSAFSAALLGSHSVHCSKWLVKVSFIQDKKPLEDGYSLAHLPGVTETVSYGPARPFLLVSFWFMILATKSVLFLWLS